MVFNQILRPPISWSQMNFLILLHLSEFSISIHYLPWFDKIEIVLLSRKELIWLGKTVLRQYLSPWFLTIYLLCRHLFTIPHSLVSTLGISHLFHNHNCSISPRCILINKYSIPPILQVKALLYMSSTLLSIMNWSSTRNLAFLPKKRRSVTVILRRKGPMLRRWPSAHL
jgi:hypothetical protein